MSRVVNEIQESSLRPTARPQDVYYRPAVGPESRLEKIAGAFVGIDANLGQYLKKKADAQWESDLATGVALFKRASEHTGRSDLMESEIRQMVKDGKIDGFARYTRGVRQGVIKAHYESLAGAAFDEVTKQFATMTTTDENGNTIALSECKDPLKVQAAFTKLWTGYVEKRTGGIFDPQLYNEYVAPKERQVYNGFLNYTASKHAERLVQQQKTALALNFDNDFTDMYQTGRFDTDEDAAVADMARAWQARIDESVSSGMARADAVEAALAYMQAKMDGPNVDYDHIAALHKAASLIPDFANNSEVIQKLNNTLNTAEYHADSRQRRIEERERDNFRESSYDFLNKWLDGGRDPEALQAYAAQVPVKFRYDFQNIANNLNHWQETLDDLMTEMPVEEYNYLIQQAWHGDLSFATVAAYGAAGHGSNTQLRSLLAIVNSVESGLKGGTNGGQTSYDKSTKQYKQDLNTALGVLESVVGIKLDIGDSVSNANYMNAVYTQARALVTKIQEDRAAGVPYETTLFALNDLAGKAGQVLLPYKDVLGANPDARNMKNDELVQTNASYKFDTLIQNNVSREGAAAIRLALDSGEEDPVKIAVIIRRNPAKAKNSSQRNLSTNPQKTAEDIIKNYKLKNKAGEKANG